MKKILSLVLVVALMSTMGISALAESTTISEEAAPFYQWKYDEPVTVSVMTLNQNSNTPDASDPYIKSYTDNVWTNYVYPQFLNLTVDWQSIDTYENMNSILNTRMASGDLPDIMQVNRDMFYVLCENGVLADLQDAYDVWVPRMPALSATLESYGDYLDLGRADDGQLLGLPQANSFGAETRVLWIRQDWLDQLGLKAPTTMAELTEVAKAFKEAKLGGDDTLGFMLYTTNSMRGILEGFGAPQQVWVPQADGSYVFGNVMQDQVSEGLLYLQDWYKQGLVKSDFATNNIYKEELSNGVAGLTEGAGHWSTWVFRSCMDNDPKANFVAYPIPTKDGNPVLQYTNSSVDEFWVVSKKCKHPDALLKIINMDWTIYNYGQDKVLEVLGKDIYQASLHFIYSISRIFQPRDYDLVTWAGFRDGLQAGTPVDQYPNAADRKQYGVLKECYDHWIAGDDASTYDRHQVGMLECALYGYKLCLDKMNAGMTIGMYNGPTTEEMKMYLDTINDELAAAMIKVIMGDDISVYQDAVKSWYANGGQTITDQVNAYYASKNQK